MPKPIIVEGSTATNPTSGEKIVYRGGKWFPADAGQPGSGAELPPLTQDQGQAQTYARLMQGAERSYAQAREAGYDPASPRNTIAAGLEGLPFGGLDDAGAAIRDDASDRGRQAELQWSDAQLRAMSGAAAPEPEVKRNVRTYFQRPFENAFSIEPQKREARTTAFEGAKRRSGPAGKEVGNYPRGDIPKPIRETTRKMHAAGRIDPKAPIGTQANPYVARNARVLEKLPVGSYVITPEGHFGIVE